ncbi:hypothetical protein, partial [Gracilimonas tropica]|uniref:hypothetical protein n=1 Tax=Gracilimonas tropica TaxID=454600 RepID=UPI001B7F9601
EPPLNVEKATHYCKLKMPFVSWTGWLEVWNRSVEQSPERSRNSKPILTTFSAKHLPKPRAQIRDFLVANHKQRTGRN